MTPRLMAIFAVLVVASAVVVAPAVAQTSRDGYSTPAGDVQADVSGNGPSAHQTPRGDTTRQASGAQLPFTGLDVGFLLAGGVVLLMTGVGMARLSRRTD